MNNTHGKATGLVPLPSSALNRRSSCPDFSTPPAAAARVTLTQVSRAADRWAFTRLAPGCATRE